MVQGVLRVGGRLQNSGLSVDQRHPAILPARHHVTGLIVQFYHFQQGHCGTQSVLNATREKFWIAKGNSSVRHYLKECRPVSDSQDDFSALIPMSLLCGSLYSSLPPDMFFQADEYSRSWRALQLLADFFSGGDG